MTPQLRVPQADCFRKCSCLVSSMSYCFRGFNLGPLDDYNVQLLVPTVGSVLHTHPTGAWLPHVATDSNRVRSGPRLVTASTETKLTPERSFTSYSGQVKTQNLHHYNINKQFDKNATPENVTPLDEVWITTNLKKYCWLQTQPS